jgi:hypothetical protein
VKRAEITMAVGNEGLVAMGSKDAEFDDLLDHQIRSMIDRGNWPQDKCRRAERCLKARAIKLKYKEKAPLVIAAWATIAAIVIIASIGGIYNVWEHIPPLITKAIAFLKGLGGS